MNTEHWSTTSDINQVLRLTHSRHKNTIKNCFRFAHVFLAFCCFLLFGHLLSIRIDFADVFSKTFTYLLSANDWNFPLFAITGSEKSSEKVWWFFCLSNGRNPMKTHAVDILYFLFWKDKIIQSTSVFDSLRSFHYAIFICAFSCHKWMNLEWTMRKRDGASMRENNKCYTQTYKHRERTRFLPIENIVGANQRKIVLFGFAGDKVNCIRRDCHNCKCISVHLWNDLSVQGF